MKILNISLVRRDFLHADLTMGDQTGMTFSASPVPFHRRLNENGNLELVIELPEHPDVLKYVTKMLDWNEE